METPLPVNDVYQKMKSKNEVKSKKQLKAA
jgi:hypothetical protein